MIHALDHNQIPTTKQLNTVTVLILMTKHKHIFEINAYDPKIVSNSDWPWDTACKLDPRFIIVLFMDTRTVVIGRIPSISPLQ